MNTYRLPENATNETIEEIADKIVAEFNGVPVEVICSVYNKIGNILRSNKENIEKSLEKENGKDSLNNAELIDRMNNGCNIVKPQTQLNQVIYTAQCCCLQDGYNKREYYLNKLFGGTCLKRR